MPAILAVSTEPRMILHKSRASYAYLVVRLPSSCHRNLNPKHSAAAHFKLSFSTQTFQRIWALDATPATFICPDFFLRKIRLQNCYETRGPTGQKPEHPSLQHLSPKSSVGISPSTLRAELRTQKCFASCINKM